jgi:hypothetical protein
VACPLREVNTATRLIGPVLLDPGGRAGHAGRDWVTPKGDAGGR